MNHYYTNGVIVQATLLPMKRWVTAYDDIAFGLGSTREFADASLLRSIEERCVVDLAQIGEKT
jgi:hypothetical protein